MLTIFRRHLTNCPHRHRGRKHRKCGCPLSVEGTLRGAVIRKSLDLTSWEAAQKTVRDLEAAGTLEGFVTLEEAVDAFMRDAVARNLSLGSLKIHRILLRGSLLPWAERQRIKFVSQFDLPKTREFRESWTLAPITSNDRLKKLRAFFAFAQASGWMMENPARALKPSQVDSPPTMPFERAEYERIVEACDRYRGQHESPERVRAFVFLLRYSGLRIGDAVTLERSRIDGTRLRLYTAKSGVPVSVPLPAFVVAQMNKAPRSERHFFWTGESSVGSISRTWDRTLRKLGKLGNVPDCRAHRFRDFFACSLLETGASIETVAMLLGNTVAVAEKHYAPWIKSRQALLESQVKASW